MTTLDNLLVQLAREIMRATEELADGGRSEDELPTSAELARHFNVRLDNVKKKLKILKQAGLIHAISVSPKRYRFDTYVFRSLPEDNPYQVALAESPSICEW
jgi:DNA-binding GntR family transcriptional regulator